jgi:hypothetical protein
MFYGSDQNAGAAGAQAFHTFRSSQSIFFPWVDFSGTLCSKESAFFGILYLLTMTFKIRRRA